MAWLPNAFFALLFVSSNGQTLCLLFVSTRFLQICILVYLLYCFFCIFINFKSFSLFLLVFFENFMKKKIKEIKIRILFKFNKIILYIPWLFLFWQPFRFVIKAAFLLLSSWVAAVVNVILVARFVLLFFFLWGISNLKSRCTINIVRTVKEA